MPFVQGKSDGPLDFDAVLASLGRHCPGTELLDGDYCASRIARLVEMYDKLGEPRANPVVDSTALAARKLGPTRQIRVPLHEGELVGTVNQGGLMLSSRQPVPRSALTPVLTALAQFDRLQVRIGGMDTEETPEPRTTPKMKPWWRFWG